VAASWPIRLAVLNPVAFSPQTWLLAVDAPLLDRTGTDAIISRKSTEIPSRIEPAA